MSILAKDFILQASDIATEEVAIPEWGGTVKVRGLTGAERNEYEQSVVDADGRPCLTNATAKLVALGAVDCDGQRIFSPQDVTALGAKSAAPLERVAAAIMRLSGMSREKTTAKN